MQIGGGEEWRKARADGTPGRGIRCASNKVRLVRGRDHGDLRGLESAAKMGFPGSINGGQGLRKTVPSGLLLLP